MTKVLICTDVEPDDFFAMMVLEIEYASNIEFFILVVSPDPKYHTELTIKLFNAMNTKRKVTIRQGARYGRDIDGGFEEPKDQSYVKELNEFMKNSKIEVFLLTTCYALMKHWDPEWEENIKMIYHMGGEGIGKKGSLGFNWKVGPEYAKMMLRKISYEKILIFETAYYNPKFIKEFPYEGLNGVDGIVSICPRTFPLTLKVIQDKIKDGVEVFNLLIEHNKEWVNAILSDWKEGKKFYPDEGQEYLYFEPADIFTVFGASWFLPHGKVLKNFKFGDEYYVYNTYTTGNSRSKYGFKVEIRFDSYDSNIACYLNHFK